MFYRQRHGIIQARSLLLHYSCIRWVAAFIPYLWCSVRSITWDVTVVDTLRNVFRQQSAIFSANAAETAAVDKTKKYSLPSQAHDFFSVVPWVSMLGSSWCKSGGVGWRDDWLLRNRCLVSNFQRLHVAVQRLNAACLPLADVFPISESAPNTIFGSIFSS